MIPEFTAFSVTDCRHYSADCNFTAFFVTDFIHYNADCNFTAFFVTDDFRHYSTDRNFLLLTLDITVLTITFCY